MPIEAMSRHCHIPFRRSQRGSVRLPLAVLFVAAAALGGVAGLGRAECVDYGADAIRCIGELPTGGSADGIAARDNFLYVANGTAGLALFDISNPRVPELIGAVDTPGTALHVALDGNYAIVAANDGGLGIVDISEPKHPVVVAFVDTPGNASQVALRDSLAFVADRASGLSVFDVSDRAAPRLIGAGDTPGSARGLVVVGDHVFVADSNNGLMIFDAADPTAPRLAGWADTPGDAWSVTVAGDLAVVSDASGGLTLIDVENVERPHLVSNTGDGNYAGGLPLAAVVVGDVAFVAEYPAGLYDIGASLRTYDISDPLHPKLVGAAPTGNAPRGLVLCGDYAYLAAGTRGIAIVDITAHTGPHVLDVYATGNVMAVAVDRDCAVAVGNYGLFKVFDIARSHEIRLLADLYVQGEGRDVVIAGTLACVAASTSGLLLVDIGDPRNPVVACRLPMSSYAMGVAVSANYAFVANYQNGLQVVDIGAPVEAAIVATCALPAIATDVVIDGDLAYVALGGSGCLAVVDIAEPDRPALLGRLEIGAAADRLVVDGSLAYLSLGTGGMLIVDVSDPTNPRVVSGCGVERRASGLVVSGSQVYLVDSNAGLQVVDVSNPASPRTLYRLCLPMLATGVAVGSECVFLGIDQGVVTAPLHCDGALPVRLADFSLEPWGAGLRLRWRSGAAATASGFRVWRETPDAGRQVLTPEALSGSEVYEFTDDTPPAGGADYWLEELTSGAASIWYGPLHFAQEASRQGLRLAQNNPNPFNPQTSFEFELSRPGHVKLVIHDVRGTLVATLVDADMPAGSHAAVWNGQDDQDAEVPSGVYLARLESPNGMRTVKLTMVR